MKLRRPLLLHAVADVLAARLVFDPCDVKPCPLQDVQHRITPRSLCQIEVPARQIREHARQ